MRCLIALRYPIKSHQIDTIRKTVKILGKRAKYYVVHINKCDIERSRREIKEKAGVNAVVISRSGDIISQLKKLSKELDIDVISLGSHKRNMLDIMLDGIVETDPTVELIKKLKKPILIVK